MDEKRFEEIYKQGTFETYKIIRDNETGVQYMFHFSGWAGGLTVMLDQDGKPLVDKDFRK